MKRYPSRIFVARLDPIASRQAALCLPANLNAGCCRMRAAERVPGADRNMAGHLNV